MEIKINIWDILDIEIMDRYPDKIVLMYDDELGWNMDKYEYHPSTYAKYYVFDTLEELTNFMETKRMNIVEYFSTVWINGIEDKSIIYNLRG